MNMPPQRIALFALALLVLVGGGTWWWQSQSRVQADLAHPARSASETPKKVPRASSSADMAAPEEGLSPSTIAALEQCSEDMMDVVRARTKALAGKTGATSRLAYALGMTMPDPAALLAIDEEDILEVLSEQQAQRHRLLETLRKADTTNADLAWIAATRCPEDAQCKASRQHLLELEGDNAAAWLRAIDWAGEDEAAVEEAFRRAARAPNYDTHRGAGILAMMEGYSGLPFPDSCRSPDVQAVMREHLPQGRVLDATTFVELMAASEENSDLPSFAPISALCRPKEGMPLQLGRQADCIRLYSAMAGGDTLVEQAIASSQLIELTRDLPEGVKWRERFREFHWTMEQYREAKIRLDPIDMSLREAAAMQEALVKVGRWPPPAGWLPESERARSLILTGRPLDETERR